MYKRQDWYSEGQATLAARTDYVRERLRLLYVGITRAKEELVLTWNTGRGTQTQALGFAALEKEQESGDWESVDQESGISESGIRKNYP